MELRSPTPPRRRRRPATRGLLFGAPLDRLPHGTPPTLPGSIGARTLAAVPIALIGESCPVAPARVTPFGSMAASWPLLAREDRGGAEPTVGAGSPVAGPEPMFGSPIGVGLALGLGLGTS